MTSRDKDVDTLSALFTKQVLDSPEPANAHLVFVNCMQKFGKPKMQQLLKSLDVNWIDFIKRTCPCLVFSGEGKNLAKFLHMTCNSRTVADHVYTLVRKHNGKMKASTLLTDLYAALPSAKPWITHLQLRPLDFVRQHCLNLTHSLDGGTEYLDYTDRHQDQQTKKNQNENQQHQKQQPPQQQQHQHQQQQQQQQQQPQLQEEEQHLQPHHRRDTIPLKASSAESDVCVISKQKKRTPFKLIDDTSGLQHVVSVLRKTKIFAFDFKGKPGQINLMLIHAATSSVTYVIDCDHIGLDTVITLIGEFLRSPDIMKVVHDVHRHAHALSTLATLHVDSVVDTQIIFEQLFGEVHVGFNTMLKKLEVACPNVYDTNEGVGRRTGSDRNVWGRRPLDQQAVSNAAQDVAVLLAVFTDTLTPNPQFLPHTVQASMTRVAYAIDKGGLRAVCFDSDNDYKMRSSELMACTDPDKARLQLPTLDNSEVYQLVDHLPQEFQEGVLGDNSELGLLSDVVLDKGRRPTAFIGDQRKHLCDDESVVVTAVDLEDIVDMIGGDDHFGGDNRAGIDGCLHRISAMRNRDGYIYGLTMRAGRHVVGMADVLADILHTYSDKSVLILGAPGTGKTTIIRDIARTLSQDKNVCIVDTSNEIAGDGDVPHTCVGYARRMMVPSLDAQARIMVECVQNHTPHVIVIDEIGRASEVSAALTVKNRGVRMIASAHGDFRKLMKNRQLSRLLGEVTGTIKPGGIAARERTSDPIFDIVVEVTRSVSTEWNIIFDAGLAVDDVIEGKKIQCQRRRLDKEGLILLELSEC